MDYQGFLRVRTPQPTAPPAAAGASAFKVALRVQRQHSEEQNMHSFAGVTRLTKGSTRALQKFLISKVQEFPGPADFSSLVRVGFRV